MYEDIFLIFQIIILLSYIIYTIVIFEKYKNIIGFKIGCYITFINFLWAYTYYIYYYSIDG